MARFKAFGVALLANTAAILAHNNVNIIHKIQTFLSGIKFIVKPVMTTKEAMADVPAKKRAIQSVICGVLIGFTINLIPERKVIKTEKFPMVVDGTRLEI